MILALAGGVGGAKLAAGLATCLPPSDLLIAVNTGDDFTHLGLQISPDLDTVMYWLADKNDAARGWGLANETWKFMEALELLGGPTWFKLGDQDLATHVERTRRLSLGETPSAIARRFCARLGIGHTITPMTDDDVRTMVETDEGTLEFQQYFVERRCEPRVLKVEYRGARFAKPSPALDASLNHRDLSAIIVCPSNPVLSIEPILQVADIRRRVAENSAPTIAISPIVGGKAIKGPAAKILSEMGLNPSAFEIARLYDGLLDGIVIDSCDAALKSRIEDLGLSVLVTDTVMNNKADQQQLARAAIEFASTL
jgi:LPPG:FO 2-phospho-L-lactate transferase